MCGLVGFIGKGSERDLAQMIATLKHRGPDDTGLYVASGVGLGHARLSIIDLSPLGHQPMWNADHTVVIVFNGEIYNYKELKKELGSYSFQSSSDTEVIIALYEKYGEKCFEKLSGMFAVALYDTRAKKLLLARDRMGKKPMYWYHEKDGVFVFASEPKALLAHPNVPKEIDRSALNAYFALDYVPTPMSIYKGINKLEPGMFLAYENGQIHKEKFWNPDFRETSMSLPDALSALDRHLVEATASRLVADVPVGIFLSGGLDSSTIAYYAAKARSEPIHTFSIGFEESSFDESQYAKEVAAFLHTKHHHKVLSAKDSLEITPKVFAMLDEPLADASIIPTYLLSRFTKEHVTVALGGDGGDELFAGYPTFQAERMMSIYHAFPEVLRRGLSALTLKCLPVSETNMSLEFKLRQFLGGAEEGDIVQRHMHWLGTWDEDERAKLFSREVWGEMQKEHVYDSAGRYGNECDAEDERNKLLYVYQRTYMMDQVMVKVDRASMYASLETRAPFLDYELVEFANRLPYQYKLHGQTTKYLLKKLMETKLPKHIVHRTKKGFGVPTGAWLRGPLKDWGAGHIAALENDSLLQRAYVEQLWNEHQSGQRDHHKKLWNILTFLEWKKNFLD
jgi:asparagine synthase (glutamine-hydrolysing)